MAVLGILLAGCGGEEAGPPPSREVIEVVIQGDAITPNGDRVKVKVGQEVDFQVTTDRDGALHVHSSPEQTLEFKVGTSLLSTSFDKPGLIEVETADTDTTVVQLQVE